MLADGAVARVALAGGSTPKAMYRLLASPAYRERVEWRRVEIYFGDERCVPPDHPDSNYRMAREALLDHVPLGADRVHRIAGERPPEEAAAQYQQQLRARSAIRRARSGAARHGARRAHRVAVSGHAGARRDARAGGGGLRATSSTSWRVTLTAPVLSAAAHVMITTVGAEKADALAQALLAPAGTVPIQLVRATDERWLVDRAAAQKWRDQI